MKQKPKLKNERDEILKILSKIIEITADDTKKNDNLYIDKKSGKIKIGMYYIQEVDGFCSVYKQSKLLYDNICLLDIALLLVEYHVKNVSYSKTLELLTLERDYYKWKSDISNYTRMLKGQNTESYAVYEDRLLNSQHYLDIVVEKIRVCKNLVKSV